MESLDYPFDHQHYSQYFIYNRITLQTSNADFIPVLLVGTLIMVILTTFIFLFVILYQRKMIKLQLALRKVQDEKQRQLMKAVFDTQEGERSRLAEDLHDSVGQVLSAIKMNLHRLDKLQQQQEQGTDNQQLILDNTKKLLDECLIEIRNIIKNVLPPVLTDFGLSEALENLSKKVAQDTGIEVVFYSQKSNERYKKEIEVMIYRIVQELFNNAIKHAGAGKIELSLTNFSNALILVFKDNGIGFDRAHITHGLGLKNIESRIQLMEGTFSLISPPGTTIELKVPTGDWKVS